MVYSFIPLSCTRGYDVALIAHLVSMHCVDGVTEYVETKSCCTSARTELGHTVQVRHVISRSRVSHGNAIAILANGVYFDAYGKEFKYVDRWCTPSLYVAIGGALYMLDSFIEHRPLSVETAHVAYLGHYVAYVRLAGDGQVWKVANDGYECTRMWHDIANIHGHMHVFLYEAKF